MESMETAPRRVGLLNTSTVNIEMEATVEIDLLLSTRNVTQAYVLRMNSKNGKRLQTRNIRVLHNAVYQNVTTQVSNLQLYKHHVFQCQ